MIVTNRPCASPGRCHIAHLKLPSIPDTSMALIIMRVNRNGTFSGNFSRVMLAYRPADRYQQMDQVLAAAISCEANITLVSQNYALQRETNVNAFTRSPKFRKADFQGKVYSLAFPGHWLTPKLGQQTLHHHQDERRRLCCSAESWSKASLH